MFWWGLLVGWLTPLFVLIFFALIAKGGRRG